MTDVVTYYRDSLAEVLALTDDSTRQRFLTEGFYFLIEDIAKFPTEESDLLSVLADYKKAMTAEGIE